MVPSATEHWTSHAIRPVNGVNVLRATPLLFGMLAACAQEAPQTACPISSADCSARVDSLIQVASSWYTGTAGTVDDVRARELLEEAVATGSPMATMWMARVYSRGRMGYDHDSERALALAASVIADVRAAAESGWTEATFLMGTAYDEGLGVAEDPAAAISWFRQAADKGHVLAAHNLGNAYAEGRGVPKDEGMAMKWWLEAAEAGDAIPQLRLGQAYERGGSADPDIEAARHWYSRAAARGNAAAAQALAQLPEG